MDKQSLRAKALASRVHCDPSWGMRLAGHVLGTAFIGPDSAVAGFWPMPGEIDIRPLLIALLGRGHPILLPETPPRGSPLLFRPWRPGAPMVPERFGTQRPAAPPADPPLKPTLLLVPLLAFDRDCNRLGHGGGYYDRTIAASPGIRTIGCAFDAQQVDAVPVLPHDAPLDAVATEAGIYLRAERR